MELERTREFLPEEFFDAQSTQFLLLTQACTQLFLLCKAYAGVAGPHALLEQLLNSNKLPSCFPAFHQEITEGQGPRYSPPECSCNATSLAQQMFGP